MLAKNPAFDPSNYQWQHLTDPSETGYKVDYKVALLGHDLKVGTCDFLLQFDDAGGHCPRHRHVGTTTSLVLAGEHRVTDLLPDGTRSERVKPTGTYALSPGDVHPHLERGGDEGAVVFFGNHTTNGLLYEIIDEDLKVIAEVSIEMLIDMWK
jgi:hypothetical protein